MAVLNCNIPSSLLAELTRAADGIDGVSHIVTSALAHLRHRWDVGGFMVSQLLKRVQRPRVSFPLHL
jgi:hypothetical protein